MLITMVKDGDTVRIIIFRRASEEAHEVYYERLEHDFEND